MRKIIVGAQVSIDGVMQAPGAPTEDPTKGFKFGGWAMPYFDQFASLRRGGTFDFPRVDVDANIGPWLAPPLCGVDRGFTLVGQDMPPRRAGGQPLHPYYPLD